MNGILSKIGLCSIALLLLYIIKKVDDYLYFKKEESTSFEIDKGDDD